MTSRFSGVQRLLGGRYDEPDGPDEASDAPAYDYVVAPRVTGPGRPPGDDDLRVANVERDFDRYPSRDAERLAEERRRARIPRLRLVPTALAVVCLTALALVVGVWWHARTVAAVEAAQPVARVGAAPVSPASVPT
ncbi:hypothetical protein JT358_17205, partial [Micrococcales bacterium 31B]|nr:hypothetical protein [Micrococcales bacterium 31B]